MFSPFKSNKVKEKVDEKDTKKEPAEKVKDLLFERFKKSVGIKVFMVKYDGDGEKAIYNEVLSELKGENYLNYTINFSGIQIFLTDIGRNAVDEHESW